MSEEKPILRVLTDEDRERIHQEAEAIKARVMAIPLDELAVQVRGRRAAASSARSSGSSGRGSTGARVDVKRIVELYTTEPAMKPEDIAKEVGCSYATVVKWLKDQGVFVPGKFKAKPPKPKPQDKCGKGHDMTAPGAKRQKFTEDGKPNGWDCMECGRERAREQRMRTNGYL